MKSKLIPLALVAFAFTGAAQAGPSAIKTAAISAPDQGYVQRMSLVGRTVQPGEQPAAPVSANDDSRYTPAQREQQYIERAKLAGRTVRAGETPPTGVSADKPAESYAERVQEHEKRMKLIGRTAQPGEVSAS